MMADLMSMASALSNGLSEARSALPDAPVRPDAGPSHVVRRRTAATLRRLARRIDTDFS